jgi:3-oxoacyl-[acyl-carrier protein] reductase
MSGERVEERRWALVTAATSGLGESFARHLAKRGYSLFLHYHRGRAKAEALEQEIRARGGQAVTFEADLLDPEAREALVESLGQTSPRLSLLINNLGLFPEEGLLETELVSFERALTLNLTVGYDLIRLALPLLRAAAPGTRIINLGDSKADQIGARVVATAYYIAKIGLNVLTRSYAKLLAPDGITVNMISPGFLERSVGEPPDFPMGRPGRFEDILGAVDYLLSPQADYVSGANLLVSGAWNL